MTEDYQQIGRLPRSLETVSGAITFGNREAGTTAFFIAQNLSGGRNLVRRGDRQRPMAYGQGPRCYIERSKQSAGSVPTHPRQSTGQTERNADTVGEPTEGAPSASLRHRQWGLLKPER